AAKLAAVSRTARPGWKGMRRFTRTSFSDGNSGAAALSRGSWTLYEADALAVSTIGRGGGLHAAAPLCVDKYLLGVGLGLRLSSCERRATGGPCTNGPMRI